VTECFEKLLNVTDGPFAVFVMNKLKAASPVKDSEMEAFRRVVGTRLPQAFIQQEREYILQVQKLG
jgi:hypothetical protein